MQFKAADRAGGKEEPERELIVEEFLAEFESLL